jgi:hypothetical protein
MKVKKRRSVKPTALMDGDVVAKKIEDIGILINQADADSIDIYYSMCSADYCAQVTQAVKTLKKFLEESL